MEYPSSKQRHNFIINMLVNTYGYKTCPEFVKYFDSEVFELVPVRNEVRKGSYETPFRFVFYVKKFPDPNDTNFWIELYSDTYKEITAFKIDLGCFPKKPYTAERRMFEHAHILIYDIQQIANLYDAM